MRRLSVLPAALTAAAFAYTNSAAAAAPEAPLAPINTSLLQGNPGAPISIDDVLLVPSASAGQKGAAFEWADGNHVQAYVLWDKFFAAAQYTPTSSETLRLHFADDSYDTVVSPTAQTIASFGYMTPGLGLGLSLAYRDSSIEDVQTNQDSKYYKFSQVKLFASVSNSAMDIYGSLVWAKPTVNDWAAYEGDNGQYYLRTDSVMLQLGARHAPAAGAEGLAWNGNVSLGYDYYRLSGSDANKGEYTWLANVFGQVGYVFFVDGINFLPGSDVYVDYANGKSNPDYGFVVGVAPNLAISVPLFEHWTLAGGAKYHVEQTLIDGTAGKASSFADHGLITNTTGNVGLRYARDRWAVEAQVANSFLSNGPYIASGNQTTGMLASFGFTVNLK